ncbi:MAG TPA: hypothetical protein VLD60_13070 [Nitrospira sp.]|nr:hypothetical protein [Nitrospira sp.]
MKKSIVAAVIAAPLLTALVVTSASSQSQDNVFRRFVTSKPAVENAAVTASFASSVNRFFPAANPKVAAVFKEAVESPEAFSKFTFREDTPFTVTVEGSLGRQNIQSTFRDFQEALFTVVPKEQHVFVASTLLGIASAFKDSCTFFRFGPDGSIVHVGIEGTAYVPGEISQVPRGSVTVSPMTVDVAKRFATALRGKSVNVEYTIDGIE